MVGTKPIALPAARSALTRLCIWVASPSTSIASAPPRLELTLPRPDLPVIQAKGRLGAVTLAGRDLLAVPGEGRRDGLLQVRVALDELGGEVVEEPEEVVRHQHLASAGGSRPDADGRDPELCGDNLRHLPGDAFEHEGKDPCLLEEQGILPQTLSRRRGPALNLETPELMDHLWGKPEVTHHGDADGCETPREVSYLAPPLQLDRLGAGLLQKSTGVPHPVFHAGLKRAERHVGYEEGPLHPSAHGAPVSPHLLHGDGQGGLIPEPHHGQP